MKANQKKEKSYEITKYELVKTENLALLKFELKSKIEGDINYFIHSPKEMEIETERYKDSSKKVIKESKIEKEWLFKIPEDGYYFIEIAVKVEPIKKEPQFSYYSVHTLYFEIKEKKIEKFSTEIDTNNYKMPTLSMGNSKAVLNEKIGKIDENKLQETTITVQISGNIRFTDINDGTQKGVPVRVWLDWDYDNNPSTGYTPYSWDNDNQQDRHIGWDDADMQGNFSFDFSFNSSVDANQIADQIRIYVANGNLACRAYSGVLALQSGFNIDITQFTDEVISEDINIVSEFNYGAAIRHLTRAWIFTKEKFNTTLSAVHYRCISNQGSTAYYTPSWEMITFDDYYPDAWTAYHEYGHYSHHNADSDFPVGFCPSDGHWFTKQTNDDCAFTEGWAEFYSAACLDYWYQTENSTQIELTGGDYQPCVPDNWNIYQFFDYGQGLLCTGRNNTAVEGAVASFLYSLYDGYDQRFNNYSGDNEDLSFSGAFLRNNLDYGVAYARYNNYALIDGYKRVLIASLDNYQKNEITASINAFYNSLFNNQGVQRPATATQLEITGDYNSRYLIWNDNTCPDEMNIPTLGGWSDFYTFFQNNETGFRIYRKTMGPTEEWDGTVNNFSLIQTTLEDIINFTDNSVLSPGRYCYVVVAFNAGGNSIPKAHKIIECSQSATPSVIAVNEDMDNVIRNFAASNLIEIANINETSIFNSSIITFCSGQEIVFNPGTTIESGSDVRAYIDNCPGCSYSSDPPLFKSNKYENFSDLEKRSLDRITIQPNPFGDVTRISVNLTEPSEIRLEVFDLLGNRVAIITSGEHFPIGSHDFTFSGHQHTSGVYYLKLTTNKEHISRQLLLIK
ncbi:MAG: T9SS type A sorting domain-containing protein [Bacteroidetes bacterium]|nr:T9SS type A sorting domain-containing protein [Bacteroidota bacterium]